MRGIDFEGRPLDLDDILIYRKNDQDEPIKTRIIAFHYGELTHDQRHIVYFLRDLSPTHYPIPTYRLTLDEVHEQCTRHPSNRDRRKGDRRRKL